MEVVVVKKMLGELFANVSNCYRVASITLTWSAILQVAIVALVSYFIYSQFLRILFSPLKYLPSVSFVPIVGSLPELMRSETGEFGERWRNTLNSSVFRYFWLFGGERVMICDADVIKGILVNKSKIYQKSKLAYMLLKTLLGEGLVTCEGDIHSRNRKICNTSFRPNVLQKMVPIFEKAGKDLTDEWLKEINTMLDKNDGEVYKNIPINSEMTNLTLDVIGKFAFDYEFKAIQHCSNKVTASFQKILGEFQLGWMTILCFIFPVLRRIKGQYKDSYDKQVEQLNKLVYSVIENKRNEMEKSEDEGIDKTNLLSNLLKAEAGNSQCVYDDKLLRDEVMTFMLAGHETTSVGMTWVLHQLSKYPEIQDKVRKEVRSVLPPPGEPLTVEHLDKMTYLTCVIKETLRLLPPVPLVVRQATEDNHIEGYYFPKGTEINISIISLHRNPKYWKDPLEFRPERFEDPNNIYPYSFLPFINGSRMCIGYKFAMMEMKTVLSLLIDKFEYLPLPDVKYRRVMMVTMHPEPSLVLKVKIAD